MNVRTLAVAAGPRRAATHPTIALALGGGGARGLAHIAVLEALDDLGLRPSIIAGTSLGAVVGAAYAAGISGADLRAHVLALLRDRSDVMARLLKARVGRFADLLAGRMGNPVMIDGEIFLDHFWPKEVPDRFEALQIPLIVLATDFQGRREVALESGPLAPAVAGSMAMPGLVKPVAAHGMMLLDGGATNPLPFGHLIGKADIVIACDVTGGPVAEGAVAMPKPFESMFGCAQIMMATITAQMLRTAPPDILIRPPVDNFKALDFFKARQILDAAAGAKEEIRHGIEARLALG